MSSASSRSSIISSLLTNEPSTRAKKLKKYKCLLGVSGSVAAVKLPELALMLAKDYEILIVCTKAAKFFLEKSKEYNEQAWNEFMEMDGLSMIFTEDDEWELWNRVGDPVLHIELRRWADVIVVAPASADLLSKASVGIADTLLLSVMRAWDFTKPAILCPAMNTCMWTHPSTYTSLHILRSWGWSVVEPVSKKLACNDIGIGALASNKEIQTAIYNRLRNDNNAEKAGDVAISKTTQQANFLQRSVFSLAFLGAIHMALSLINANT
jgi:phosphopantothenoylcysteine decarboxylase